MATELSEPDFEFNKVVDFCISVWFSLSRTITEVVPCVEDLLYCDLWGNGP